MKNSYIIGCSGHKNSGKDYFYKLFQEIHMDKYITPYCIPKYIPYECKKFAGKLKTICSLLTGLDIEYFYNNKLYNIILPQFNMNIREFQQKVGTEALRMNVHENIWVSALFSDYTEDSKWMITDVRFPNEAIAIKDRNGILIRIERPSLNNEDSHPSEIGLDDYKDWDYIIINDGTEDDYKNKIEKLMKELGVI